LIFVEPQQTLERWFNLLVKHKFGIAAVPVAGIAIGLLIVTVSQALPPRAGERLQDSGLFLVQWSIYLFIAAAITFIVIASPSLLSRS
jgi:hypothetical protein